MGRLVLLIVVFAILATLLVLSRRRARSERFGTVVYERRHLFTKGERSFLRVLDEATGDHVRAFGKVRLGALLQVPSAVAVGELRAPRNYLAREHVDFVLCDSADLRVLAVVELDDASHDRERIAERDAVVEAALTSAGIPILRFAARSAYAVDEVRRRLEPVVPAVAQAAANPRGKKPGKGAAGRRREPAGRPVAVDAAESGTVQDTAPEGATDAAPETVPATATVAPRRQGADGERNPYARLGSCPTCGRPMVERIGKRGALKGKPFLVCSGDPPCDTTGADG